MAIGGYLGRGYFFGVVGEWVPEKYENNLAACASEYLHFERGLVAMGATPEFCAAGNWKRRQTTLAVPYIIKGNVIILCPTDVLAEWIYEIKGGKLYLTYEDGSSEVFIKYKGIGWSKEEREIQPLMRVLFGTREGPVAAVFDTLLILAQEKAGG